MTLRQPRKERLAMFNDLKRKRIEKYNAKEIRKLNPQLIFEWNQLSDLLDSRLSALPSSDSRDGRRSTESRQFKTLLEKDVIALTLKEGIALTLDSRLSADFRQKRGKAKQKVDSLK